MKTRIKTRTYHKVLFLFLIGFLFSCQVEEKPKIGFLLPNLISDRYSKEKGYFSEHIKELGGEALVASAENDDKLQIRQATEMISQGAKVLVVNPINRFTSAEIVRIAHDAGIKVIAYDRLISNSDLDYYLSFDNEKAGELMAEYAIKKYPTGTYLIFGGDKSDLNASFLVSGQLKILEPYINSGKIKIGYNIFVEEWSDKEARSELKKYLDLSTQQPDVILSSYDGMSTGIISTLKEYNLEGKVLITGQDAEITASQNILKGNQSMTIYKSLKKLAGTAAELSMKLASTTAVSEINSEIFNGNKKVPSILLEPIAVDSLNMRTTVIADGHLSESDLLGKSNNKELATY